MIAENTKPFFSIIIPTYNRANLILKTLNSIFAQTFSNYEIIVVDNASTDNTLEILQPLIDAKKIKFIQHDKNYERSRSRNTGMENAKGKFLTLLDSDDLMYPNNLQDAYNYLQNNSYQIIHNLYELVDENSTPIYQYKFKPIRNRIAEIATGNFLSCIGVFISEEIYQKYRFDTNETLQGIEDWEYWMRILADYEVGRVEKINSGIVHHSGRSIKAYELESYIKKCDYIITKFSHDKHLAKIYLPYFKSFKASCLLLAAAHANSGRLFKEARKYSLSALKTKPSILFKRRFIRIVQKAIFGLKNEKGI